MSISWCINEGNFKWVDLNNERKINHRSLKKNNHNMKKKYKKSIWLLI